MYCIWHNQAEQLAIFKALENVQNMDTNDKTVQMYTDSRIALESLKNQKSHKHLIEKIRRKVIELERQNWKIDFNWIKAHAGHQGNELADELAKETNSDIKVCYDRIPKSAVKSELSENSETKWQIEWDRTTKDVTTKLYFPKVADRLKLKIRVTPNLTMMVTGHGNISHICTNIKL